MTPCHTHVIPSLCTPCTSRIHIMKCLCGGNLYGSSKGGACCPMHGSDRICGYPKQISSMGCDFTSQKLGCSTRMLSNNVLARSSPGRHAFKCPRDIPKNNICLTSMCILIGLRPKSTRSSRNVEVPLAPLKLTIFCCVFFHRTRDFLCMKWYYFQHPIK